MTNDQALQTAIYPDLDGRVAVVVGDRTDDYRRRTMDEQQIKTLAEEWTKAEIEADTDFLEHSLAGDFIAVGPRGFVLTKSDWISRHATGNLTYESLELDEASIRDYGEAAVMVCVQRSHAIYRDGEKRFELDDDMRMTVIFISIEGESKIAGLQLSQISGPPNQEGS